MRITDIIWKDGVVEKLIGKHGVSITEVEETLRSKAVVRGMAKGRVRGEDIGSMPATRLTASLYLCWRSSACGSRASTYALRADSASGENCRCFLISPSAVRTLRNRCRISSRSAVALAKGFRSSLRDLSLSPNSSRHQPISRVTMPPQYSVPIAPSCQRTSTTNVRPARRPITWFTFASPSVRRCSMCAVLLQSYSSGVP